MGTSLAGRLRADSGLTSIGTTSLVQEFLGRVMVQASDPPVSSGCVVAEGVHPVVGNWWDGLLGVHPVVGNRWDGFLIGVHPMVGLCFGSFG